MAWRLLHLSARPLVLAVSMVVAACPPPGSQEFTCQSTSDCATGYVCGPQGVCQRSCSPACGVGQVCDAHGHCMTAPDAGVSTSTSGSSGATLGATSGPATSTPPSTSYPRSGASSSSAEPPSSSEEGSSSSGPAPSCGDGHPDPGEACDDGNTVDGDACDSNCTLPGCGNDVLTPGEECDDGNTLNGDGCDSNCTPTGCGNRIPTPPEACDDGNTEDGDGCDSTCTLTGCGNGIQTEGEPCDDGNTVEGDGCDSNCTPSACGNHVQAPGEPCDDGNTVDGDGCDHDCTRTGCGNGIQTEDEPCDDGDQVDGDGCDRNCTPSACGNGVQAPGELCDDGNTVNGDGCDQGCTPSACGNGVQAPLELCDDGNTVDGDGCDQNCTPTGCGNGIITAGEMCDDGNTLDGDLCSHTCRDAQCGNGDVDQGEECDDGNEEDGDECDTNCTKPVCGNRVVVPPEVCDDGNTVDGDGCDANCTPTGCGNHVVTYGEGCDDGDNESGDGCSRTCLTEHPEQEPNDSAAAANGDFLAPCAVLQDPSSAADVDWFVIRLDRRADLRLETSDGQGLGSCAGGLDTVLRLYLPDGTTSVASDDDGGVDRCSLIDPQRAAGARALAPGNYFAYVYRTANAPASILHATLQECGDGRLEQSEVCDDGNATAGDGCTAACLVETGWQCGTTAPTACWPTCGDRRVLGPEECDDGNVVAGDGCSPQCRNDPGHFFERESNNTRETANGPLQPDVVVHGAISPVGDQDVVTVELAGATDLWLETTDLRGLGYCQTIRTRVELRGPTGASLVQVTTGGTGGCSRVDPATHPAVRRLAAGSYTVHVSDDNNTEAIPGYLLHVTGQLCGDGVLQGREACDDGGRQDGDGCSELCTVEVGWTCAPPGTCTPTCGDARLVGAETCEDGNTVAGDGCSQVCQNEPGHFFEVEPNNASLDARDTSAPVILHGAILPATDVDWYQVQLAAPWDVRVVLTGAGGPGTCTGTPLVRLHAEQGTVLAQAAGTTGVCPRIEPTTTPLVRGLAPGNYRVSVEENGRNAQIAAYQAHVTLQRCGDRAVTGSETCDDGNTGGGDGCSAGCLAEPGWACQGEPSACAVVCGDGIRLPQEVCDDGNTVGADGCSPVCLAEPGHVFEAEPNTRDQPNGPYPFPVVFHGAITPVGDVDHVVVETTAPGSLKVETVQSSATSLCPSIDTVVAVYDATGLNRLAMDDSSGEGSCSLLDPATTAGVALRNLAAGRYIVAVWDRGSDHAIPGYVLVVSFTRAP